MVRVILHGCSGVMGHTVTDIIKKEDDMEIVAGIDKNQAGDLEYPVFESLAACDIAADVIIDFSNAAAMDALFADMKAKKIGGVICTTGLSDEQKEVLEQLSQYVPILKSANMSLGINTIFKALKLITPVLSEAGFDMEIVEMHHNRKLDAPSGTAYALADAMNESVANSYTYVTDRSARRQKRDNKEIGLQALRGGTVPGVHDVIFAGNDEVIKISHTAYSRAIFAKGAVQAAKFLSGRAPGFYDMKDVIG